MGDFEPRMDKWGESEFSSLGLQFKDAIFNKGRLERERKRAAQQAARRARWKRSWLGRFTAWVWSWFLRILSLVLLFYVAMFLWNAFQGGSWVFGQ